MCLINATAHMITYYDVFIMNHLTRCHKLQCQIDQNTKVNIPYSLYLEICLSFISVSTFPLSVM